MQYLELIWRSSGPAGRACRAIFESPSTNVLSILGGSLNPKNLSTFMYKVPPLVCRQDWIYDGPALFVRDFLLNC